MRPNTEQEAALREFYGAVKRRFGHFGTWSCEVGNENIIIKVHVGLNGGVDLMHAQHWLALLAEEAGPEKLGERIGAKLRHGLAIELQQERGIER